MDLQLLFDNRRIGAIGPDDDHVIDAHLRTFAHGVDDVRLGAFPIELRSCLDGRVFVARVEVLHENRVAVGGEARNHERPPRLQPQSVEQRRLHDRRVPGYLHGPDERAGPFANLNRHDHRHHARRRRLRDDGDVGLRRGKTRSAVHIFYCARLDPGQRLRERLAFGQPQRRRKVSHRQRGVAVDPDPRDAVLLAPGDAERDEELAVALRPLVRRLRVPVALRLQHVFDAGRGILEQILIHGAFALDGHQLTLVAGKRLAVKRDPHVTSGIDGDRQVDRAVVVDRQIHQRGFGFVVPLTAPLCHVAVEPRDEGLALEGRPGRRLQMRQHVGSRAVWAGDIDRSDDRARARVDLEHQRRVTAAVRRDAPADLRAQVAARVKRGLDEPRELVDARRRRRRPGAFGDDTAQVTFVDAGLVRLSAELDGRHGPDADHVEADRDPRALPRRVDANVVEPAHGEQVQHRLADVAHRQRLPGADGEHAEQHRLARLATVDDETDGRDRLAEILRHVGASGSRQKKQSCHTACPPKRCAKADPPKLRAQAEAKADQNECLTRNSSA